MVEHKIDKHFRNWQILSVQLVCSPCKQTTWTHWNETHTADIDWYWDEDVTMTFSQQSVRPFHYLFIYTARNAQPVFHWRHNTWYIRQNWWLQQLATGGVYTVPSWLLQFNIQLLQDWHEHRVDVSYDLYLNIILILKWGLQSQWT